VTAPRYAWRSIVSIDPSTNPPTVITNWTVGDVVPPDAVATRTPGWDNFMGYGLTGSDPGTELSPTHYIAEVRLDWWPVETHSQSSLQYYSPTDDPEAPLPPSVANAADYNARVAIRWIRRQDIAQGIQEYSRWVMIPFKNAAFVQGVDQDKVMGISIAQDYTIDVMVDKEVVFTTDGLKVWRNTWQPGCLFKANEVKYQYPKGTRVYLDDVVATDSADFAY
jgi:hypothetical protein